MKNYTNELLKNFKKEKFILDLKEVNFTIILLKNG